MRIADTMSTKSLNAHGAGEIIVGTFGLVLNVLLCRSDRVTKSWRELLCMLPSLDLPVATLASSLHRFVAYRTSGRVPCLSLCDRTLRIRSVSRRSWLLVRAFPYSRRASSAGEASACSGELTVRGF